MSLLSTVEFLEAVVSVGIIVFIAKKANLRCLAKKKKPDSQFEKL